MADNYRPAIVTRTHFVFVFMGHRDSQ